jgi:hypothetical protein
MLSGAASADAAATYSAAPGTTDAPPTTCTAAGAGKFTCANLRSAIVAADNDPDSTVQLSAGTYKLTNVSTAQLNIDPTGALTIAGAGAPQTTIEQTDTSARVMDIESGPVTISGLVITGGTATTTGGCQTGVSGGGIVDTSAAMLTLDHVTVTGNNADGAQGGTASSGTAGSGVEANGGGICTTGPLTLTDSTVSGNTAKAGRGGTGMGSAKGGGGGSAGGGGIDGPAPLILNGTAVSSNHAIGGAGGPATGTGNAGEAGGAEGGGIEDFASTAPMITDAVFSADTVAGSNGGGAAAGNGGGGGNAFGSAFDGVPGTISDSTFSGGMATGGTGGAAAGGGHTSGGGGFAYGAAIDSETADRLTITGSTISGNTGTAGDAGAATAGASSGSGGNTVGGALEINTGSLVLTSSAVTGNRALGGSPAGSGYGGAMDLRGTSTIVDATITGNEGVSGSSGAADGGGIEFETTGSQRLTLASVTLAGNTVDPAGGSGSGGNLSLVFATSPKITVQDTIIAGGTIIGSGGTGSNCDGAVSTDTGHNLESTTPSQCGFSAAKDDVIGKDPLLGPLGANDATTDTLALGAGSPALAAGGQCTDPSNGGQPLSDDQRGQPRGDPCDIGAFEAQAPKSTAAPRLTGTTKPGDRLTCTPSFSGDAPLAYAYTWQRGQSNIAGATDSTYKLADQDQGQQLSCTVTATNPYGTATAASTALSIPKPPKPKVTSIKQSHSTWREGSKKATLAAAKGKHQHRKPPVGTTFTFKLNTPATVKLTFTTSGAGRKVKHKCVKQTHSNRHDRACKLTTTAGTLTFSTGHSGIDRVAFDGRLSGRKKLKPGIYKLQITATNSSGKGSSKSVKFTIAG